MDEFDNFNGNLVAKLKDGVVQNLSTLFMYNCMRSDIPFDDLHVSLFKPARLEMGGFHHLLPCDIKGENIIIIRGPFKIKDITACRFSKGMPEILSYKFETEMKPQEGDSNKKGDEDQQELPGFNSKTDK